jgi:hypothetical protein
MIYCLLDSILFSMAIKIFREDPEPDTTGSVIKWTLGTRIRSIYLWIRNTTRRSKTVCLNKTLPKLYRPFFEKGQFDFKKAISDPDPITLKILDQTGSRQTNLIVCF